MGADMFITESVGKTAQEAFDRAVERARHDHGHAGYTGTIAEKEGFVFLGLPIDTDPIKYAEDLVNGDDPRIEDKWGPAGCIMYGAEKGGEGKYLFFGWASS